ncbi:hypothetical protein CMV_029512 [Castanea mollissima]|uniref:Uncharacterized protein n=1 Tax=Castanea mollissima TaxID=60419 RepID=A0A8J4Q6J1_9ROSI|nr:hypothetical protein CMV_029512 [Castanea mollissima]
MHWSTVRPPYDDDDHISDEDDVEQELDLDVRKMSITPRNPLSYWISNGLDEPRGMPARSALDKFMVFLMSKSFLSLTLLEEMKSTLLVLNRRTCF